MPLQKSYSAVFSITCFIPVTSLFDIKELGTLVFTVLLEKCPVISQDLKESTVDFVTMISTIQFLICFS